MTSIFKPFFMKINSQIFPISLVIYFWSKKKKHLVEMYKQMS